MNKEILKRFFEGRSNKQEQQQVHDYLQGDEMGAVDEYIQEQDTTNDQVVIDQKYKQDFFEELRRKVEQKEAPVELRRNFSLTPLLKIAAGIVLICTVSSLFYLKRQKQVTAEMKGRLTRIINNGRNLKMVELADGTKIWMNPGTTITYNKRTFSDSIRHVNLSGEAYFNVAHDANKPFRVKAGQLTTTVLGTSFNVEAYENEAETRVMLVTGSVKVNAGKSEEMLRPGQLLDFSKHTARVNIKSVDISDKEEQFTHGRLVFENLPLEEVLKRVARVFDIKITVADDHILKNKQITGTYYRDNANLALTRILFIHGLRHHKKGENNYVIER